MNLMPFTRDRTEIDINRDILNVYVVALLESIQQSCPTGSSSNDLPRDKDDQWKLWKAYFGMMLPRQSKREGLKR